MVLIQSSHQSQTLLLIFFSEPICVVTEFVSGGNLKDLLVKSRIDPLEEERPYINVKSTLTERQLIKMAVDIANGMRHLASKQVGRNTGLGA